MTEVEASHLVPQKTWMFECHQALDMDPKMLDIDVLA